MNGNSTTNKITEGAILVAAERFASPRGGDGEA